MSGIHGNLSTGSILRDFYTSGVCNTYKRYKKFTPQTFVPNKTLLISRRQAHRTKKTVFCDVCCFKLFAKWESRPFMVTVICLVLSSNICRHLPPKVIFTKTHNWVAWYMYVPLDTALRPVIVKIWFLIHVRPILFFSFFLTRYNHHFYISNRETSSFQ